MRRGDRRRRIHRARRGAGAGAPRRVGRGAGAARGGLGRERTERRLRPAGLQAGRRGARPPAGTRRGAPALPAFARGGRFARARWSRDEAIACDYVRCGTITLAAKPGHLRDLEADARFLGKSVGYETTVLGAGDLAGEIGSARYHGGLLDPNAGSLHPGALRAGPRARRRARPAVDDRRAFRRALGEARGEDGARHDRVGPDPRARRAGGHQRLHRLGVSRRCGAGSCRWAATSSRRRRSSRTWPRDSCRGDACSATRRTCSTTSGSRPTGGWSSAAARRSRRPRWREAPRCCARGMARCFPSWRGRRSSMPGAARSRSRGTRCPTPAGLDGLHYSLAYAGHGVAMSTWLGTRMGDALAGARADAAAHGAVPRGAVVQRHAVVPAARGGVLQGEGWLGW